MVSVLPRMKNTAYNETLYRKAVMQTLKAKATSVKNHVANNRGKYGFAAGVITVIAASVAINSAVDDIEFSSELTVTPES